MTDEDRTLVNYATEVRDGPMRMRFPVDPDTTARLERLRLDPESRIPRWRRLLRWFENLKRRISWQQQNRP